MDCMDGETENTHASEVKCVNEVVRIILMLDHSKKAFKQSDITRLLMIKPNRKMWTSVFNKAKESLNKMGLTLRETKHSHSKSFFLTSQIHPFSDMHQYAPDNEIADRTLLILILTFIFMKERPVSDADIFNHLQQLKIYCNEKPVHEYFGDVKKKIMTEFVGQMYLEKVINKESDRIEIKWGERAHAEITKRSILEFVCKLGYQGAIEPKTFGSHYQRVEEEEEEQFEIKMELDENV